MSTNTRSSRSTSSAARHTSQHTTDHLADPLDYRSIAKFAGEGVGDLPKQVKERYALTNDNIWAGDRSRWAWDAVGWNAEHDVANAPEFAGGLIQMARLTGDANSAYWAMREFKSMGKAGVALPHLVRPAQQKLNALGAKEQRKPLEANGHLDLATLSRLAEVYGAQGKSKDSSHSKDQQVDKEKRSSGSWAFQAQVYNQFNKVHLHPNFSEHLDHLVRVSKQPERVSQVLEELDRKKQVGLSFGELVRAAQEAVNALPVSPGVKPLALDGMFGPTTRERVVSAAQAEKVQADTEMSKDIAYEPENTRVFLEWVAHILAYESTTTYAHRCRLKKNGYERALFRSGALGLEIWAIIPDKEHGRAVIGAFRGTENWKDIMADLNDNGVGERPFEENRVALGMALDFFASQGSTVWLTGHSLGGALAQITAACFPSRVDWVFTVQSAGVSKERIRQLADYNAGKSADQQVKGEHWVAEGDPVSLSGEGFIEGNMVFVDKKSEEEKANKSQGFAAGEPGNHGDTTLVSDTIKDQGFDEDRLRSTGQTGSKDIQVKTGKSGEGIYSRKWAESGRKSVKKTIVETALTGSAAAPITFLPILAYNWGGELLDQALTVK